MSAFWSRARSLIGEIKNSRFVRDVGTLASGAIVGRILRILSIPLIARLFDPEHYGPAAFIIAIAMTLNTASSLRYADALVLPETASEARQLSRLAWRILISFSLVVAVIGAMLPAGYGIPSWLTDMDGWWALVALVVFLLGWGDILRSWAVRLKAFKAMGQSEVVESGASAFGRIAWGAAAGSSIAGLMAPFIAALLMRVAWLSRAYGRTTPMTEEGAAGSVSIMAQLAKRYANFPRYGLPGAVFRTVSERIPLLVLGALFAPTVVGLFSAAERLIRMPAQGITQSVRQVYLQRASAIRRRGTSLRATLFKSTALLAILGVVPFGLVMFFGEALFAIILGERWAGAGTYAQMIAPWGYTMFILGPAAAVYVAAERQRTLLAINVVRVCLFVLAAVLLIRLDLEAQFGVAAFAAAGAVSNLIVIFVAFVVSGSEHVASLPQEE